jgi:hypothetical protein
LEHLADRAFFLRQARLITSRLYVLSFELDQFEEVTVSERPDIMEKNGWRAVFSQSFHSGRKTITFAAFDRCELGEGTEVFDAKDIYRVGR